MGQVIDIRTRLAVRWPWPGSCTITSLDRKMRCRLPDGHDGKHVFTSDPEDIA